MGIHKMGRKNKEKWEVEKTRVNWGLIKMERKFIVKYRLCFQIGLEDNEEGFGNAMGFVLNIWIPVCLRDSKDRFQTRSVWDIRYQDLEAMLTILGRFYIVMGALGTVALGREPMQQEPCPGLQSTGLGWHHWNQRRQNIRRC